MMSVARASAHLRERVLSSGLSPRELARKAGLGSDNTVRKFMQTGQGQARTLEKIEAALDRLSPAESGSAAKTDVQ
jgi:transcriptional regulator with XRE-family HTH domain